MTAEPDLLRAILDRHSDRSDFDIAPPDAGLFHYLLDSTIGDASASLIADRDDIEFVAAQTSTTAGTIIGREFK